MAGPDLHVSAWRENARQGTGERGKAADLGGGKFRVVFGLQVAWGRGVERSARLAQCCAKGFFGLKSAVLASLGVWLPSPQ